MKVELFFSFYGDPKFIRHEIKGPLKSTSNQDVSFT
jgi:hypothetical protein